MYIKAPEPIVQWNGTLDAFKYQNSCYQQSWSMGNPPGQSEDCLYLNIFVSGKLFTLNIVHSSHDSNDRI